MVEDKLKEHEDSNVCKVTTGETCPLCFQEVAGEKWKQHLEACPKNERNQKPK